MTIKKYSTCQDAILNSFIVFSDIFDSGKYDEYVITEKGTTNKYKFKHERIVRHLQNNPNDRDSKPGVQNGKEFVRFRLILADNVNKLNRKDG